MIVVWRVTERCNLRCGFCAYDRRLIRPRGTADPGAALALGEALAAYQQRSGDDVLVSWLGGEPLLWAPLRGLTTAFVERLGLQVSTTTNGTTLASAAMRAHLLTHYSELTISVDGVGERHDALRGWKGGYAALRRSVRALAAEKRDAGRGPLLRANVVLMRDNVAQFGALCGELGEWGIEEITFNQLGGNDRPEFYRAHRLSAGDVEALARDVGPLRDSLRQRGVRVRGGEAYLERIRSSASGLTLPVTDCGPGEGFLFVSETGVVSPCSFTGAEYGVPLAELRTAEDIYSLRSRFAAAHAP